MWFTVWRFQRFQEIPDKIRDSKQDSRFWDFTEGVQDSNPMTDPCTTN